MPVPPQSWSSEELGAIVRAYAEMLEAELNDQQYVKADFRRHVQSETDRSKAAVEFKFCNISAVLRDEGCTWVMGYAPRSNYQRELRHAVMDVLSDEYPAVLRRIANDPQVAVASEPRGRPAAAAHAEQRRTSSILSAHPPATQSEAGDDGWWLRVGSLWEKATGGEGVAAAPDADAGEWPTVRSAPGVDEALVWLRAPRTARDAGRLLFLVGGPGAGKSEALRRAVDGLEAIDRHDDGLAHRSYRYRTAGRELVVINDATIPDNESSSTPLVADVTRVIATGSDFMACVNRGILVEEVRHLPAGDAAAGGLIRALLTRSFGNANGDGWAFTPSVESEFLVGGELRAGGRSFGVLVVYVDVCSLFERRPRVQIDGTSVAPVIRADAYSVARVEERAELDEETMPAGALLARVVDGLTVAKPPHDEQNPILANVQSLRSGAVRSALLTVLRASEVVAGARFTFRELWGAIVRCVVGDLTARVGPDHVESIACSMRFDPEAEPLKAWECVERLGALRFTQVLFTASLSGASDRPDPVSLFTNGVDPVLDARAGDFVADEYGSGWARPVTSAFAGLVVASSPLESLLASSKQKEFAEIVTPFDRMVDATFMRVMGDMRVGERARAATISWYGDYLLRMYAVSLGVTAYREEVGLWSLAWAISSRDSEQGQLPKVLDGPLRTLLMPRHDPDDTGSSLLIPVFASRARPIIGDSPRASVAVRGRQFALSSERRGDGLRVVMREDGRVVGEVDLDFPILREALSCSSDHVGVTEQSTAAGPRLERFRAGRLAAPLLAKSQIRVVDRGKEYAVTVEVD